MRALFQHKNVLAVFVVSSLALLWLSQPVWLSAAIPEERYRSTCNSLESLNQLFICYELEVEAEEHQPVRFVHESGEEVRVLAFKKKGKTWARFTAELPGTWTVNGTQVVFGSSIPEYANGFLKAAGNKWVQNARGKAIIPQYIMYEGANIKEGIKEFVTGHGFSGFHIANLRDFLKNPEYFEAVVLETYRAGGTTHFWIWGDRQRKLTPEYYDGDVDYLYNEILARLGPLPGWSVGYGFDLFEWADSRELETWKERWKSAISYSHLMGARGHKNRYREISKEMDYTSWEWHRPDIDDYILHLQHSRGKPVFSEDRFRIRQPPKYPQKDYTEKLTVSGLWNSFLAGGVANIWGNKGVGNRYSRPYELKSGIKKYRDIVDKYYRPNSVSLQPLENVHCLKSLATVICRSQDVAVPVTALLQIGIRVSDVIDIESGVQNKAGPMDIMTDDKVIIGTVSQ